MSKFLARTLLLISVFFSNADARTTGFYVSGGLGTEKFGSSREFGFKTASLNEKRGHKKPSFNYTFELGYLHEFWSSFVVGGNVFFNDSNLRCKLHEKKTNYGVTRELTFLANGKHSYGVSVLAGKFLNKDILVYGKGGYEIRKMNLSLTGNNDVGKRLLLFMNDGKDTINLSKDCAGFTLGFGSLYKITDSVFIGAEYSYTRLKKIEYRCDQITYNFDPRTHRMTGKIMYVF